MKIFALLDCNNFYVSCERLFRPELNNRPVVILSNNDGCVIARSNEAKALGIKMGEPVFKCEYLIKRHQVQTCSANFPLYADLSHRVMSELYNLAKDVEVYSIDEAFLLLGDSDHLDPLQASYKASFIHAQIERAVGISISIGIATSKTLAKLANRIAKNTKQGVFSLYFDQADPALANASLDSFLCDMPVAEVWGIGWAYQKFLRAHGLHTALDLKYANPFWIKATMKVQGLRTLKELNGIACIPLITPDQDSKASRSIISSRSFGQKTKSLAVLKEAVASFTAVAAHKLRKQKLAAKSICIFVAVSKFSSLDEASNQNSVKTYAVAKLEIASFYTPDLIAKADSLVEEIYQEACYYKKAGVVLYDLVPASQIQLNFFDEANIIKQARCINLVDRLNQSYGANTMFWGAMGVDRLWAAKQVKRSKAYTTSWQDLPLVG